jgi:hypothetical protein
MTRRILRAVAPLLALGALAACATTRGASGADDRADAERAAREALARERTIDARSFPARSVSVAPFQGAFTDTSLAPLSYALADLLLTDLAQSRQLVVVERLRLDAVLRELQLASAGAVDRATAPRVGRIVGARRLVLGRVSQRPRGEIALDLGVADASTGALSALLPAVARTAAVLDAEKALVFRVFDHLGVTLAPSERAAIEQRQTQNLAALLAYGRAVRYEVFGDWAAAAREYAEAERRDPGFRQAGQRRVEAERRAMAPAARAASSLQRAAFATTDRINGVFMTPIGGAARPGVPGDPAFAASTATIFVTITTPP